MKEINHAFQIIPYKVHGWKSTGKTSSFVCCHKIKIITSFIASSSPINCIFNERNTNSSQFSFMLLLRHNQISVCKRVLRVQFELQCHDAVQCTARHCVFHEFGSNLANAVMVGNWSTVSEDLIPCQCLQVLKHVNRVRNAFVVKREVEVDAGPDVVRLGYSACNEHVFNTQSWNTYRLISGTCGRGFMAFNLLSHSLSTLSLTFSHKLYVKLHGTLVSAIDSTTPSIKCS